MTDFTSEEEFYYIIVNAYLTRDDFLRIFRSFDAYEDIPKKFIARDVFRMINISQKIGVTDPIYNGLNLVLITSIIELLTKRNEYLNFSDWFKLNEEKSNKKKIMADWNTYIEKHGIRKNFRSFFLDLDNKIKFDLLLMIKRRHPKSEEVRPFCYQGEKCNYDNFYCQYRAIKEFCPAIQDETYLKAGIKALANHIYDFRSLFVHEARLPSFAADYDFIKSKFNEENTIHLKSSIGYVMKEDNKYISYISELYIKDFYELLMNNLSNLMSKYLEEVKE